MIKKFAVITLIAGSSNLCAANYVALHNAPLTQLNQFSSLHQAKAAASTLGISDLKSVSLTKQDKVIITRYQQFYKGIPIVGAQVTLSNSKVNGHLFDDIQLNTTPKLKTNEAISLAKKSFSANASYKERSQLQIRADQNKQLQLVYLVSFKTMTADNKPAWPFFVIDAQTGAIIKQWNNIQNYSDTGPGGNERVQEYWYGKDGLPALNVTQNGQDCLLDDDKVSLVNVASKWDWQHLNRTPYKYACDNNAEDFVNGAYSVGDDAYFFGHTIVDVFKEWYGVNVLQDNQGNAQKLIMRVHFGEAFDNAFWDGESMTFGDGNGAYFYPFVSLDIAGHEVAHGFTEQHSNLEYHDQSGALNEAFSDMAGQVTRAYMLETTPDLYNKAYLTPNKITWGIGETIIRPELPIAALRFMDLPSKDTQSADCVDKKMARSERSICSISFAELIENAEKTFDDENEKQGFIVHTASGIFNRAFYLLSEKLGIKTAFHVMLVANTKYWTPTTDFNEGACGVVYAAKDLQIDTNVVQSIFRKVGIDTNQCID